MILHITAKTNGSIPQVNTLVFKRNGEEIIIDRDRTYYKYDKDKQIMKMKWYNCYILEEDDYVYDFNYKILKTAVLDYVDIEVEADEDYVFDVIEWHIID